MVDQKECKSVVSTELLLVYEVVVYLVLFVAALKADPWVFLLVGPSALKRAQVWVVLMGFESVQKMGLIKAAY